MIVSLALAASLLASPTTPAHTPAIVVELFTSEGCSSCPPAEALLRRLARDGIEEAPTVRVLALEEHVDYWDGPAWHDQFSSRMFTERQERYARRFRLSGPYTPQAVVGGENEATGGDRAALAGAIRAAARSPPRALTLRVSPRGIEIQGAWDGGHGSVLLAEVEDAVRVAVTGGENAGRTLEHASVVRRLLLVGEGNGSFQGVVPVPTDDSAGARRRWIAFAQLSGQGRIVAAGELEASAQDARSGEDAPPAAGSGGL